MENIYIFDYLEIDNKIMGITLSIYNIPDQKIWWSYQKLFKPPLFKRKKYKYYNKDMKKLKKYKRTKVGKKSKNFSNEDVVKIRSIFCTPGNYIVCKNLSPKIELFLIEEFGIILDDIKDNINIIKIPDNSSETHSFIEKDILDIMKQIIES